MVEEKSQIEQLALHKESTAKDSSVSKIGYIHVYYQIRPTSIYIRILGIWLIFVDKSYDPQSAGLTTCGHHRDDLTNLTSPSILPLQLSAYISCMSPLINSLQITRVVSNESSFQTSGLVQDAYQLLRSERTG